MTPPAAVEDLFLAALDRVPADRSAFVAESCAGDPDRLRRVRELLAAHDLSRGPLDTPPVPAPTADMPPAADPLGTAIGPYKLIEVIGEGGMGTVYLAQQQVPVKRLLALKVIKAGMDTAQVIARFEAERQALALMDHPNIAKVFDAGATPEGRPYFVMELVKGVPITRYCDDHHLTPRERLELFVPVCQAVQHAHQKGIIHRDLKPTNVLVAPYDGRPIPKVIDFGVAKAAGQGLTDKTLVTGLGAVVGTLEYMSPEQAELNNLDVDTRSDVYSLGVLLYELLTGTTPLSGGRLKRAALLEALRLVREEEPPKPSRRLSDSGEALASISARRHTEPARLTRLVRGELDWIAMKALEKDRNRRYETANGLAMDVQRYLVDEAVQACPPSARYRLKKFVRRNRRPVLAASVVVFALLAGIAGTTLGLFRAEQARSDEAEQRKIAEGKERDALKAADEERQAKLREAAQLTIAIEQRAKAEKARDRTRDVLDAMTSDVTRDSLSSQQAITEEQKKFLAEVLIYYKEFAGEKAEDERSRRRTASAARKVGLIECRLGHFELSATALRMALNGYTSLAAEFPTVLGYREDLARSHNTLGNLLTVFGKQSEAESEAEYRRALVVQERLAADFPAEPAYRGQLARFQNNLGNLLATLGKRAEAEKELRKVMAIREKLVVDFPAVPSYLQDLATSHKDWGSLLAELGKHTEAEVEYRKGLLILEKLAVQFPPVPTEVRYLLPAIHNNLGALLAGVGKRQEAEVEYRKSLSIQKKRVADFPAAPGYLQDLARFHNNLGKVLADFGKRAEAEDEYRKGLAIQEKLAVDFPTMPVYRSFQAWSHNNLGNLLKDLGKLAEAAGEYRKGMMIQEKLANDFQTAPDYRRALAWSHNNLGNVLAMLGKRAEAEGEYGKTLAISEKLVAEFPTVSEYRQDLAFSLYDLACLWAIASAMEAEKKKEYADRAMETLRKAVKAGYSDAAHMAKDKDLDPLRDRDDFKKLLESLPIPKPKENWLPMAHRPSPTTLVGESRRDRPLTRATSLRVPISALSLKRRLSSKGDANRAPLKHFLDGRIATLGCARSHPVGGSGR